MSEILKLKPIDTDGWDVVATHEKEMEAALKCDAVLVDDGEEIHIVKNIEDEMEGRLIHSYDGSIFKIHEIRTFYKFYTAEQRQSENVAKWLKKNN